MDKNKTVPTSIPRNTLAKGFGSRGVGPGGNPPPDVKVRTVSSDEGSELRGKTDEFKGRSSNR